jgi:single-stranded DNA-binding protein
MSTSPSTSTTTTIVGFLGKDPIERYTPARTYIQEVPDPVVEELLVEREFTIQPRPYWKLSVATHRGQETRWHDCIVWSPEHRTTVQNAHLARKGDQVKLSGRYEDYSFTTTDGQTISGRHFVVEAFNFKRLRKSPYTAE